MERRKKPIPFTIRKKKAAVKGGCPEGIGCRIDDHRAPAAESKRLAIRSAALYLWEKAYYDRHMEQGRAERIKVVFADVDGVFTDNRVLEGAPYKGKWRSYYDGQGVSLLRAIGIRIALITNESGESAKHITDACAKWNALPSSSKAPGDGGWEPVTLYTGIGGKHKVEAAERFLEKTGFAWEECAYMGDDLVDAALMRKVRFRAAPISGDPAIKGMAHFISERPGGYGAFRDFANHILSVRGIDPLTLPPQ